MIRERPVRGASLAVGVVLIALATPAQAHRPSYGDGFRSVDSAFEIEDPDISIVLYAEMTCEREQVWMHMRTGDRQRVWVELGVPKIDRLESYRPSLAVVAPGLPEADVPFAPPPGMGVEVIDTRSVESPEFFLEEFTSTASWILFRGWVDVPAGSDAYLVAWDPEYTTGKLWVAVGDVEDFSDVTLADFVTWQEATQSFHEVREPSKEREERCREHPEGAGSGCEVGRIGAGSGAGWPAAVLALGALGWMVARRRRCRLRVAHRLERTQRGGLGDVLAISAGGMALRRHPGAPGVVGLADGVPVDVPCLLVWQPDEARHTSAYIDHPDWKRSITGAGEAALAPLCDGPWTADRWTDLLEAAEDFATNSGIAAEP